MPSPGMRGWYVELDAKLIEEFEKVFPEQGMKTVLTARAVVWAIQEGKIPTLKLTPVGERLLFTTPGGDNVQRNAGDERSLHTGTEGPDPRGSRSRE